MNFNRVRRTLGIYDVEIIPAQISGSEAKWRVDDVNTFNQGPRGWVGLTARTVPCGSDLDRVFQSRSGTRTTIAFHTISELPGGTSIARVDMDIVFLQDRGAQEASVYVFSVVQLWWLRRTLTY